MVKKYIEFNLVEQKEKTQVYAVRNINEQLILGYIKWNCAWRQYCFFPESKTLFSRECMSDVINFIDGLMIERHIDKIWKTLKGNMKDK